MKLDSKNYSVFKMYFHLVFVTKHCRKVISDELLEYKIKDEGKTFIKINKYNPYPKTSSLCGNKMDRDHNVAINIATQCLLHISKKSTEQTR